MRQFKDHIELFPTFYLKVMTAKCKSEKENRQKQLHSISVAYFLKVYKTFSRTSTICLGTMADSVSLWMNTLVAHDLFKPRRIG